MLPLAIAAIGGLLGASKLPQAQQNQLQLQRDRLALKNEQQQYQDALTQQGVTQQMDAARARQMTQPPQPGQPSTPMIPGAQPLPPGMPVSQGQPVQGGPVGAPMQQQGGAMPPPQAQPAPPPAPYAARGPQPAPAHPQPQGATQPVPFNVHPDTPAIPNSAMDARSLVDLHRGLVESIANNPMYDKAMETQYNLLQGFVKEHPQATIAELSAAMHYYDDHTAKILEYASKERGHAETGAAAIMGALVKAQERNTPTRYQQDELDETKRHHRVIENRPSGGGASASPDTQKTVAQMVADYEMAPPSLSQSRSPRNVQLMAEVKKLNPTYDATQYQARSGTVKEFTGGKSGQQVQAFNTAIDHLGTLDDATKALANGDIKGFNAVSQMFAAQSGDTPPTDFDAVKMVVGKEVVKAIIAGGGGVTERQEAEQILSKANSPQQLAGVMGRLKQLMAGQLRSLEKRYSAGSGRKDFSKFLTPGAQEAFDALSTKPGGGGGVPAGWSVTVH